MAAALKFAKYDYKFEFGDGGHSGKHGGAILPDRCAGCGGKRSKTDVHHRDTEDTKTTGKGAN